MCVYPDGIIRKESSTGETGETIDFQTKISIKFAVCLGFLFPIFTVSFASVTFAEHTWYRKVSKDGGKDHIKLLRWIAN